MVAEFAIMATLYLSGALLAASLGLRRFGIAAFAFLGALFLFVTIGFLQVVAGLPTNPIWTLAAVAVFSVLFWWWRPILVSRPALTADLVWTLSPLVLIGLVVGLSYFFNPVKYHIDSFRYLLSAWLLADGNYQDLASLNLLTKRNLTVPIMHSIGRLFGEGYSRSVTPLLSLSLLSALVWFYAAGTKLMATRAQRWIVGVLLVLLLVSTNRYVFHSFYLNGHLFFAACFVVIAASGWLLATTDREVPCTALLAIAMVSLPALIVTRPEAPLMALLALAPMMLSASVPWRSRALVLAVYGISTMLWSGYIVIAYFEQEGAAPFSATGLLILGVVAVAAAPLLMWSYLSRVGRVLLVLTEGILWLALIGLAVRKPEVLTVSLSATYQNLVVGNGKWGSSIMMLSALVLLALAFCREKSLIYLRFPVTASIPLFFLLAYFREGPYRVGVGDSLNRMLIQIVPLAVLYIAVAATSERWAVPSWVSGRIAPFRDGPRTAALS